MSTRVKSPMQRMGRAGFKTCEFCNKQFTALGLPRHWDHCEKAKEYRAAYPENYKSGKVECDYCKRAFTKEGMKSHENRCKVMNTALQKQVAYLQSELEASQKSSRAARSELIIAEEALEDYRDLQVYLHRRSAFKGVTAKSTKDISSYVLEGTIGHLKANATKKELEEIRSIPLDIFKLKLTGDKLEKLQHLVLHNPRTGEIAYAITAEMYDNFPTEVIARKVARAVYAFLSDKLK